MLIIEIKNRLHSLPIVNYIFVAALVVFGLVTRVSFGESELEANAFEPADPKLWQLLISPFLHAGPIALFYNVFHLFFYGDNVENIFGSIRYPFIYLVCGVAGLLVYWYIYPYSAASIVGSSASVAGIMGAYLVFFPNAPVRIVGQMRTTKIDTPTRFYIGFIAWIAIYLFLDAAFQMSSNGREGSLYIVITGLVSGILIGAIARKLGLVRLHLQAFQNQSSTPGKQICPQCYSELDIIKSGASYCEHCHSWIVAGAKGTRVLSLKRKP